MRTKPTVGTALLGLGTFIGVVVATCTLAMHPWGPMSPIIVLLGCFLGADACIVFAFEIDDPSEDKHVVLTVWLTVLTLVLYFLNLALLAGRSA